MKPIVLYDPEPVHNDYLSRIYFDSLHAYARDSAQSIPKIASIQDVGGCTIITHGDHLTPETIRGLKGRDNKIIAFDINDSSWLIRYYCFAEEVTLIDKIYKFAGIQKFNEARDFSIDSDFNVSLVEKQFLPEESWERYYNMALTGRLSSLPYVPWASLPPQTPRPFSQRSNKILIRGGAHFGRFLLFLFLLSKGQAHESSSFISEPYFRRECAEQFRFCEECIAEKERTGKSPHDSNIQGRCTSPATWGGVLDLAAPGLWNNKCPKSFFWLADQFSKRHGPINTALLEQSLNGLHERQDAFSRTIGNAVGYGDLKWLYSVYAPPRFWEAASLRTVNYLPARTNDQTYFPHMEEGKHYLTFREDFRDFDATIDPLQFFTITDNANRLYEEWIRGAKYRLSTKLLEKIYDEIKDVANG